MSAAAVVGYLEDGVFRLSAPAQWRDGPNRAREPFADPPRWRRRASPRYLLMQDPNPTRPLVRLYEFLFDLRKEFASRP